MIRIKSVRPLNDFNVEIELTNGHRKIIDLEPFLRGPIFQPLLEDPKLFRTVRVDERLGTIVWENGADIDPDVLIYNRKPAWVEDITLYSSSFTHANLSVKESRTTYRTRKRKRHS